MTARVPRAPILLGTTNIKSGKAVRGDDWSNMARTANWLQGGGASLVPAISPMDGLTPGYTNTYEFKIRPRGHANNWLVIATLSSLERGSVAPADREPLSAIGRWRIDAGGETGPWQGWAIFGQPSAHFQQVIQVTPSSTAKIITVEMENYSYSESDLMVEQLAIYEIPRYSLDPETASEYATDVDSCQPNNPIYDAGVKGYSVDAFHENVYDATSRCRRAGVASWAKVDGFNQPASAVGSPGVWVKIVDTVELLGRKQYTTDSADYLEWWVDVDRNGDSESYVKLVTDSGYTSTVTLSIDGRRWWGPQYLYCRCENMDTERDTAEVETVSVYLYATSTDALPTVYGFSIGEN